MSKLYTKKYQVMYVDTDGVYHTSLFSTPPTSSMMREYKIKEVIDVQAMSILIRDDDASIRDVKVYEYPSS